MATNSSVDGWEGTWIAPVQNWTPPTEVFVPMTAEHKAHWVEFLTSPQALTAMGRIVKEDEDIKKEYAAFKINKDGVMNLLESSFNKYEMKGSRLYRAFKMYQDDQIKLLNTYKSSKTSESYNMLIKHIGAHGHLMDDPIPKKC